MILYAHAEGIHKKALKISSKVLVDLCFWLRWNKGTELTLPLKATKTWTTSV